MPKDNIISITYTGDSRCPFCHGEMDSAEPVEISNKDGKAFATQECHCGDCGSSWIDEYVWRRAIRLS